MEYSLNVKSQQIWKIEKDIKSLTLNDSIIDNRLIYTDIKRLSKYYLRTIELRKLSPKSVCYLENNIIHEDSYFVFLTRLINSLKSSKTYTPSKKINRLELVLDEFRVLSSPQTKSRKN